MCVFNVKSGAWSAVSSFLTAPPVGPQSTVSFIAVADLGHTEIDGSDEYDYDVSFPLGQYAALVSMLRPFNSAPQLPFREL